MAVVRIYASGAPSPMDTWDPKPPLNKDHNQKLPGYGGPALGSPFRFRKQGKSGIEVWKYFRNWGSG